MQPSEQFTILTAIIDDTRQIDDITEMLTSVCVRLREALDAHNVFVVWEQHGKYDVFAQARPLDERGGYALKYVQVDYNGESFGRDDAWVEALDENAALVVVGELSPEAHQLVGWVSGVLAPHTTDERFRQWVDHFAGVMSKEMKGAIVPVTGWSDLVVSGVLGALTDKQRDAFERMSKQAKRGIWLIDDFRDIARLKSEQLRLRFEPLNMISLVHVAHSRVDQKIVTEQNLTIEIKFGTGNEMVSGDIVRLEQVIVVLLNHALLYAPKGSQISVNISQDDENVLLSVTDYGTYIPEHMAERVFAEFFVRDYDVPFHHMETGLTLHIAKHIMTLHGGKIGFESNTTSTTFYIALPIYHD